MEEVGIPPSMAEVSPEHAEPESVEAVFERLHRGMVRLAGLMTGDQEAGADLVADAFAGFISASHRGAVENPDAYLRKAVVNGAIGRQRHRAVRERHAHRVAADRITQDQTNQVDAQMIVWDALQSLSVRQRAVLVLRYYQDLPVAEVAEYLDMPVGTVKSMTSRALARLETKLSGGRQ